MQVVAPTGLPQEERGDEVHHALGIMQGHEGDQSIRVRFRLTDAAQAGNEHGLQRYACAGWVCLDRQGQPAGVIALP